MFPARDAFFADRLIQDGVIRDLEIIGQVAKNVRPETRARATNVPWKRIAGMRDRLIPGYFGVSLPVVWRTVKQELPALRMAIDDLLSSQEQPGSDT